MLGGVIVHGAPIGHAFVKVVSFGLHRSFCETWAGLPGTRGRYALAVRAAHFLATSAVTADALPFMHPTAMQTNPTSALSNFTWANIVYPKAKHRGHRPSPVLAQMAAAFRDLQTIVWRAPAVTRTPVGICSTSTGRRVRWVRKRRAIELLNLDNVPGAYSSDINQRIIDNARSRYSGDPSRDAALQGIDSLAKKVGLA